MLAKLATMVANVSTSTLAVQWKPPPEGCSGVCGCCVVGLCTLDPGCAVEASPEGCSGVCGCCVVGLAVGNVACLQGMGTLFSGNETGAHPQGPEARGCQCAGWAFWGAFFDQKILLSLFWGPLMGQQGGGGNGRKENGRKKKWSKNVGRFFFD